MRFYDCLKEIILWTFKYDSFFLVVSVQSPEENQGRYEEINLSSNREINFRMTLSDPNFKTSRSGLHHYGLPLNLGRQ